MSCTADRSISKLFTIFIVLLCKFDSNSNTNSNSKCQSMSKIQEYTKNLKHIISNCRIENYSGHLVQIFLFQVQNIYFLNFVLLSFTDILVKEYVVKQTTTV